MLRRMGLSPVARHKDDKDHRGEKCVEEPETTPDPERSDDAGGENQRIGSILEKSELHSYAEKADRADGESFLDPVAIEQRLGDGEFGARIGEDSEDQQENTC